MPQLRGERPASAADGPLHTLTAPDGSVEIFARPNGRLLVTLKPSNPDIFIPRAECETSLPLDVISAFLEISFAWLCDSLARHEDPEYVAAVLRSQTLAYFDKSTFRGKRILDFGCGSGASTLCLGALFPETEVIGVELSARSVELARRVLAARPLPNVRFLLSPDPNSLPPDIGSFDFVMLSAVYEHLLPDERLRVMPLLWSSLHYGGVLFVNQTPYRYFPYEHHSTGLWLVNYLPDRMTHQLARKFSRMNPDVNHSPDWTVHLRGGIRGGSEAEIIRNLRLANAGKPTILQPTSQDRAAYWFASTNPRRLRLLKRCVAALFRVTDKLWGTVPSVNLDVVIRKDPA
jgi:SAM-dependent methyltransferase